MRTREALWRERMETTLPVLLEMLISAKKIEGRTSKTTSWYRNMLNRLVTYMGDTRIGSLSVDDARRVIADLQSRQVRYSDHPISPEKEG
jgi:hypothetical protein